MLFPTYWSGEGFPGVIIDAYIAGVPVIASDWNFNKEVVSDDFGIIVPPRDENSLFLTMKDVLDGKYNLYAMSRACQNKAQQYDNRVVLSERNLLSLGLL